jgi:hypothetical protein
MRTRSLTLLCAVLLLAGCQSSPRPLYAVDADSRSLVLDLVVEHELSRNCFGSISLDKSDIFREP